jgi:hypothetical protein
VGVFFNAPCWYDPDFFGFLILQRLFGSYDADLHLEKTKEVKSQTNLMHSLLSRIPELSRSETLFSPYSDCGIFGFTFHGN